VKKWSISGTVAGVIAAGLFVATPDPALGEAPAAPSGPVMVEVSMPGDAQASGTVRASLLPSSRSSRANRSLNNWTLPGSSYSVEGGRLTLELDPADVPKRYVDGGGLVTVQIDYADPQGDRAGSAMRTVRAISTSGVRGWIDPDANLPSLAKAPRSLLPAVAKREVAEAAGLRASRTARALLTPAAPSLRLKVEKVAAQVRPVAGFRLGTRTVARDPIGGVPKCRYLNKWTKRWGTIGTSYPLKGSKSWLTYTSSSSSSFGIAVSLYGGSFKASDTRTLGDDWGQNFVKRNFNRSFRVQVRYRLQRCTTAQGKETSRRWVPQWETGGTWAYRLGAAPSHFKKCVVIASGSWFRGSTRGRDYALSYGVKFKDVIGLDLTTKRAYSNGARLYYDNPHRRRVCGNNDDPSRASKVRERRR
jgi:hypothetical protein